MLTNAVSPFDFSSPVRQEVRDNNIQLGGASQGDHGRKHKCDNVYPLIRVCFSSSQLVNLIHEELVKQ